MANQNQHSELCLDTSQLDRLIKDELDERVEYSVLIHIDNCEACQDALERMVGLDDEWKDAKLLANHHAFRSFHSYAASVSINRDRILEIERLKEYLGPTDNPSMIGRLGSYEICGLIGHGSTGIVMKAHEPSLNRFVAIKMLAPSFALKGSARARFEREGKSVAAIRDQHVVPIHAVNEFRGIPYIVMQYVAGGSLNHRIENQGPLETREVVQLGMQIARGLAAAHAVGIVHRDIKPANVLLERNVDRAIVSDFGLAQVADESAMTQTGVIAGTPQFMSPEQAKGEPIDPRSDLFSLGSVLYAACTGRAPFRSETVFGVIKKVCDSNPQEIREINPRIAPWLEALISKLHRKDRNQRFPSAQQVAAILENELAHLNSPAFVSKPKRNWMEPISYQVWRLFRVGLLLLLLLVIPALGLSLFTSIRNDQPLYVQFLNTDSDLGRDHLNAQRGRSETEYSLPEVIGPDDKELIDRRWKGKGSAGQLVSLKRELSGSMVDGFTIYLPESYDSTAETFPVHFFTSDIDSIETLIHSTRIVDGVPSLIITKGQFGGEKLSKVDPNLKDTAIVITPNFTSESFEDRPMEDYSKAISEILTEVVSAYRVDRSRIYLRHSGDARHSLYEYLRDE